MKLRRWLFVGAALCALVCAATLALALCCVFELIEGQCELWLLGPFTALPLGLGLGLIGGAAGRSVASETPATPAIAEPQECDEREET